MGYYFRLFQHVSQLEHHKWVYDLRFVKLKHNFVPAQDSHMIELLPKFKMFDEAHPCPAYNRVV